MKIEASKWQILGPVIEHDYGGAGLGGLKFRIESIGERAFEGSDFKPKVGDIAVVSPQFGGPAAVFFLVDGTKYAVCQDNRVSAIAIE